MIARKGFVGASLSRIALAAGVEKGHLTYYFRTKDDLLFEIIDDLHRRFLDGLDVWESASDPASRLHHVFGSHVRLVFALHKATRVSYENMRFLSRQRYAAAAAKRREYELRLEAIVDAARPSGAIADVPTGLLVRSVLAMASWPYQWYAADGPETEDQVAELLADRVITMLRP